MTVFQTLADTSVLQTGASGAVTLYVKGIVAFYFIFLIAIGLGFRRLSKNTGDYFRCGGAMPWWSTGNSAWIASFTAWTFVGAAAKVYETGTLMLCVCYAGGFGYIIVYFFTCSRPRRTRAGTWMESFAIWHHTWFCPITGQASGRRE